MCALQRASSMSWLFGYGKPSLPEVPPSPSGDRPQPPSPPNQKEQKKIEDTISSYRFDSAALERAAKAARELESSSTFFLIFYCPLKEHAREAFELSQKHEQTLQMEYQAKLKVILIHAY